MQRVRAIIQAEKMNYELLLIIVAGLLIGGLVTAFLRQK